MLPPPGKEEWLPYKGRLLYVNMTPEKRTAFLQGTVHMIPTCPLFGGPSVLSLCRYEELLLSLPEEVKADRYCHQLLDALSVLADDMYAAGPVKMSKKKLIQVLSVMKPFELQVPDVKAAVKVRLGRPGLH